MAKWEYLYAFGHVAGDRPHEIFALGDETITGDRPPLAQWLAEIGQQGWELSTVTGSGTTREFYLKRLLPD